MDIDATFLPVADTLINATFPTSITYHRAGNKTYDPTTGTVTGTDTDYAINAGVLSRRRVEEGGPSETYELMLWVEHKTLPVLPTTADTITYDNTVWKVTAVDPTYSSKSWIASKVTCRSA